MVTQPWRNSKSQSASQAATHFIESNQREIL